ncbi:MAG: DUF2231 domain-containing protein [Pyrinomonadaceae bacterium]|nr:DUF2231 domain-containing protein [Pyrinomonadaceae bacterium]
MESRFTILGHALHPILIVFPFGLLATAVIFDLIYLVTRTEQWSIISFWLIAGGIIGGIVAAVPGVIDWWAIPANTRAKSVGMIHGIGNVAVIILFLISWLFRRDKGSGYEMAGVPGTLALFFSFAGIVLALFTGWLGGELIERLGVSVHDGANLNAPNSLTNNSLEKVKNSK